MTKYPTDPVADALAGVQTHIDGYEVIFFDIETVDPSGVNGGPYFWYATTSTADGDDKRRFTDLYALWSYLTDIPDDPKLTRFIVAHNNLGYDMLNIAALLPQQDEQWRVNAVTNDRNDKRIHRLGTTWEIYPTSWRKDGYPTRPIVAIDSMDIMPGALARWGDKLGLPKGDTPIADVWRPITAEDWEYCERDVDILRVAWLRLGGLSYAAQGIFTTSSATRHEYSKRVAEKRGEKLRKRTYSPDRMASVKHVLPPKVYKQAQADLRAYMRRCERAHPHYPRTLRDYEKSKALKLIEEAHADALGTKAQQLIAKRRDKPEEPLTEAQTQRWYGIKPVKDAAADIIACCVVPHDTTTQYGGEMDDKRGTAQYKERLAEVNLILRPGLRGGISRTFNCPDEVIDGVDVYDVNSLYPSILLQEPILTHYIGRTVGEQPRMPADEDAKPSGWIAHVRLKATVKPGHWGTIKRQERFDRTYKDTLDWDGGEGDFLTHIDYDVLKADYRIESLEFLEVYYFTEDKDFTEGIREHIAYWQKIKDESEGVEKEHAKLQLNSIWGYWAMVMKLVSGEGGVKKDIGNPTLPLSAAIMTTSHARSRLAAAIRQFPDAIAYVDTDSTHLIRHRLTRPVEEVLDVHDTRFGAWKLENLDDPVSQARYLKPKTYMHVHESGHKTLTTAGARLHNQQDIDINEFTRGWTGLATSSKTLPDGRRVIYTITKTIR